MVVTIRLRDAISKLHRCDKDGLIASWQDYDEFRQMPLPLCFKPFKAYIIARQRAKLKRMEESSEMSVSAMLFRCDSSLRLSARAGALDELQSRYTGDAETQPQASPTTPQQAEAARHSDDCVQQQHNTSVPSATTHNTSAAGTKFYTREQTAN